MQGRMRWSIETTLAAVLLLVAGGCDNKADGGKAASSGTAKGAGAATSAAKDKDPAQLVKELANPATRDAAKQALIDYDWNGVAGGFPDGTKRALNDLLTGSTDHAAVQAAIEVCGKIGASQSYPCDDGLKILVKKNSLLSSDEAKANRDLACAALSPGASDELEKDCP